MTGDLLPIDFALHAQACGAEGFTLGEPREAADSLRGFLAHSGPAVLQAVVDPNEPPLPGNVTIEQSLHFAEALAKGDEDRWEVLKTVAVDRVREVI